MSIPRAQALLLLALVATSNESFATVIFTGINGVFTAAGPGDNGGLGTNIFTTGSPSGSGAQPNLIAFFPNSPAIAGGVSAFVPTGPIAIGTFLFQNGVTATGTSANYVVLTVSATALLADFDPALEVPVLATASVGLVVTQNLTGDPVADGDYWIFPNIGSLLIPEGARGRVTAFARFIPYNFGSPPKNYTLEIVSLVPEAGSPIIFVDTPEPSSLPLSLAGLSAVAIYSIRRRSRRIAPPSTP